MKNVIFLLMFLLPACMVRRPQQRMLLESEEEQIQTQQALREHELWDKKDQGNDLFLDSSLSQEDRSSRRGKFMKKGTKESADHLRELAYWGGAKNFGEGSTPRVDPKDTFDEREMLLREVDEPAINKSTFDKYFASFLGGHPEGMFIVTKDQCPVYEGPEKQRKVVAILEKGDDVHAIQSDGKWIKIGFKRYVEVENVRSVGVKTLH